MRFLKIQSNNPTREILKETAQVLKKGGVIIYPTDTAYGIGANALDGETVKRVYQLKGRTYSKPTHVIVRDWEMIEHLTQTTPLAKVIYDHLMPGPITLVLNKKSIVPNSLTANLPTIGVRISKYDFTLNLSKLLPFPYTTPSANREGGNTPYSIDEVKKELDINKVDLIIDAGQLNKVKPSTILDLTRKTPRVIREGPITKKYLEELLGLTIDAAQ